MRRRRPYFLLVAAGAAACNAILGIDGEIQERVAIVPPDDAGDAALRDGATGTYEVTPPVLTVIQTGKKRLDVTASSVAPDNVAKVTLEGLPKGVTASPAELEIRGPATQSFQISVEAFAPPVSWKDTRVVIVSGGGVTRSPITIDVSGPMDTTFGDGGVALLPFRLPPSVFTTRDLDTITRNDVGLAVLPDETLLVAFSVKLTMGDRGLGAVARLDRDGRPDATYGDGGVAYLPDQTRGYGITLLDDGSPIVTGAHHGNDAGPGGAPPQVWAAALNAAGGVLSARSAEVMGFVDEAIVSPVAFPNKTLVGLDQGTSDETPPSPGSTLVTVTGHPVTITLGTVVEPTGQPYALVRASDTTVFIVGESANALPFGLVLRRFLDGSIDTTWGTAGLRATSYNGQRPNELFTGALDDGGVIFGGAMAPTQTSPLNQLHLARFDLVGASDTSFGDGGFVGIQPGDAQVAGIHAIVVMPDGRIIVGGYADYAAARYVTLAAFGPNGSLDKSFGVDGFMTFYLGKRGELRRLLVQKDQLVAAIVTSDPIEGRDVVLVRFKP